MLSANTPIIAAINGDLLIPDIGYSRALLAADVEEALAFHAAFQSAAPHDPQRGLHGLPLPEWAPRLLRKKGVAGAVIEKLGSLTYTKRRPDDTGPFAAYVQARLAAGEPLLFRAAFGPLKNVNCCDGCQEPDLAELLTLIQMARLMAAVAPLYPHGVKVQLVPDDMRARRANLCPAEFTRSYIAGLRRLAQALSFDGWMMVEDGQARLYERYRVVDYYDAAEQRLNDRRQNDPEGFARKWRSALDNAEKNMASSLHEGRSAPIEGAAWRYLAAHQAEILSGMWAPRDAFPLVFANHPDAYQIYSLGHKKSKLPWQICLPARLLDGTKTGGAVRLFLPPEHAAPLAA